MINLTTNTGRLKNYNNVQSYNLSHVGEIAPCYFITDDYDKELFSELIKIKLRELLNLILRSFESTEELMDERLGEVLADFRANYPLRYENYSKSCTTIEDFLFSNNDLDFVDYEISLLYNSYKNKITMPPSVREILFSNNSFLNTKIEECNHQITTINNNLNLNYSFLPTLTNHITQNYKSIIESFLLIL